MKFEAWVAQLISGSQTKANFYSWVSDIHSLKVILRTLNLSSCLFQSSYHLRSLKLSWAVNENPSKFRLATLETQLSANRLKNPWLSWDFTQRWSLTSKHHRKSRIKAIFPNFSDPPKHHGKEIKSSFLHLRPFSIPESCGHDATSAQHVLC